jgi:hypothetical protein
MPLVNIVPKDRTVQVRLAQRMVEIRSGLKAVICGISGFPESDVFVRLTLPNAVDPDPLEVDFVVYADTCPHEGLEAKANELCIKMAQALIKFGLTDMRFEVWPRFLPGPWALVENGAIVDTVSHPRN